MRRQEHRQCVSTREIYVRRECLGQRDVRHSRDLIAGWGCMEQEATAAAVHGVLACENRSGQGQAARGTGWGVHGLFAVVVTLPMSQLLMSWLKEVAP